MSDRLFTPRFFIMCGYSFTVFVSVFQLLPTAPYRVLALGGSTTAAGLFLGFLTYSSAFSAPLTGSIGDRVGQRRVLIIVSLVLALFTSSYALIQNHRILLAVVIVHGLFWSALLSSSGAYMTATLPATRRAEGLGYWGLSSVIAIGTAPAIGFWVYRHGWVALCLEITALNLLMGIIAWCLPDDHHGALDSGGGASPLPHHPDDLTRGDPFAPLRSLGLASLRSLATKFQTAVEWRVLMLSAGNALISFGYGALTSFSALFADSLGISPRSLFLTAMAVSMLAGRLSLGRALDRIGHRRVLVRCLLIPAMGLAILAVTNGSLMFAAAGLVFGVGFGLMSPAYTAFVMSHVPFARRGAAFGAMLAAFDTGIGTGSSAMGWLVNHVGYREAFGLMSGLAALSLPSFLFFERRLGFREGQRSDV